MIRSLARRIFGLVIRGALVGALLAVMTPPKAVSARTCSCHDSGGGSYSCNVSGKACDAGNESCVVVCG